MQLNRALDQPTPETQTPRAAYPARRRLGYVMLVAILAWSGVMFLRNRLDAPALAQGPAPEFTLYTFDDGALALRELQGNGVVLNFWASWCGPCRAEAELLEAAARREAGRGVVFVGINHQDSRAAALAYMDEFDKTYVNGPDAEGVIARAYGVRAIPDTIFIDPQGQIQGRVLGPLLDPHMLEEQLARIRPAPAPSGE